MAKNKRKASSANKDRCKKLHKNKDYKQKYGLDTDVTNRYMSWTSNPTVQPDSKTEMGVPIPSRLNTQFSKEYQEENQL